MDKQYILGAIIVIALMTLVSIASWNAGHSTGRKVGFYEGWEDGCEYTKQDVEKERLANPFHKRLNQANRRTIPRPDSAGPIRVHHARLRGDYRLPTNKTLEEQKRDLANPPTKLSPNPLQTEEEK